MSDQLATFLAKHPRCELCRTCGNAITPAAAALPRDRSRVDDPEVPYRFEARAALRLV